MKKTLTLLIVFFMLFSCKNEKNASENSDKLTQKEQKAEPNFGIVIHGGAGTILKKNMSDSLENAYKEKLEEAITVGHTVLKNGGSAMEAVTKRLMLWKILLCSMLEKELYLPTRKRMN